MKLKYPKGFLEEFHVLACSSFKFGPILDFLGSTDSLDPRDFKNGLKMALKGCIKAVRPLERSPDF